MKSLCVVMYLQLIMVVGILIVRCTDETLLNQITTMVDVGGLNDSSELCKLKSKLGKLYDMEIRMNPETDKKDLQDMISYVLTQIDTMGEKCEPLETLKPAKTNPRNLSNNFFEGNLAQNPSVISENITSDYVQSNESNISSDKANECGGNLEQNIMDCDYLTMENYGKMVGEDATERSVCDDCQIDYNDKETSNFDIGIREAQERGTKTHHKVIMTLFSFVGLGIVLLIVSLSVATYFGVKRCNLTSTAMTTDKSQLEDNFENITDRLLVVGARKRRIYRCKLCSKELRGDWRLKHLGSKLCSKLKLRI